MVRATFAGSAAVVTDITQGHEPFYVSSFEDHPKLGMGKMADFLESYTTEDGLDLPSLINDDTFNAIKLLFCSTYYVSCMKLIVSFIDTVSYLEFGYMPGGVVEWLRLYMSMQKPGITELQLWELRNSILHMSHPDSSLGGRGEQVFYFAGSKHSLLHRAPTCPRHS
jgi:hypothetical protein